MSPKKGPLLLSTERLVAARTPPIQKPRVPTEVLRKYRGKVPLRRPSALPQKLAEEPLQVSRPEVDQAIAAAEQGNTIDVRSEGREFTVRVAPSVRQAIQKSGLGPDELVRFLDRLARVLGSQEAVANLPPLDGAPELRVYRTVMARSGVTDVFRLVLALLPESSAVVVVSCFSRQERTS
jgi:hypothetical protein